MLLIYLALFTSRLPPADSYLPPLPRTTVSRHHLLRVTPSPERFSFLANPDQGLYLASVLRRSVDSCRQCLQAGCQLIEVEFPSNRKADLSVTETLDTNRRFARDFADSFASLGKSLWMVFPDRKEASLARKSYGERVPFTLTSIEGMKVAPPDQLPKLIVSVNPGFNVEEWIDLASVAKVPTVVINGNLDRLRNGYYPSLFYPGLARVSREFYSKATQALFLR